MSIAGIASNILSSLNGTQNSQNGFHQIQTEFQQLGQDLQSGNLSQAQSDYATLSQELPGLSQNSANAAASNNPVAQAFAQLGQDLQAGNLTAAQTDYTTLQQDAQQVGSQEVAGHHRHHHAESSQNSSSSSSTNPIVQAFSQLAQSLQSGNFQGAQSAFTALQNDLQQIGGFASSAASSTAASAGSGALNVVA